MTTCPAQRIVLHPAPGARRRTLAVWRDPVRSAPAQVEGIVVEDVNPDHPGDEAPGAIYKRQAVNNQKTLRVEKPAKLRPQRVVVKHVLLEVVPLQDAEAQQREESP